MGQYCLVCCSDFDTENNESASEKFVEKSLKFLKHPTHTRDSENSGNKSKPEKCLHDTPNTYRELYPERSSGRYDESECTEKKERCFGIESIREKTHFDRMKRWNRMLMFVGIDMYRCAFCSPWLNTDIDEIEGSEPLHDVEEHNRLRDDHSNTRDTVGHMDSDSTAKTESRPESHLSWIRETIACAEDKVWTWTDEGQEMQETDCDNEGHSMQVKKIARLSSCYFMKCQSKKSTI